MMLKTVFDESKLRLTTSNIMQQCNMLDSTRLDDVATTFWIRVARP